MDSKTKKLLRIDVLMAWGQFAPTIYRKYSRQYTTTEIRLEILKILLDNAMAKTTQALYKQKRIKAAKKQRKIKEKKLQIENNYEENNEKLFAELVED